VTRRASAVWLAMAGAIACSVSAAAQTPAGPLPTWEQKLASILRLEDQRILRDPRPAPAPQPAGAKPAARKDAPAAAPAPVADLVVWLSDPEGRTRRRAALAVGRVGLAEGVMPLAKLLASDPEPEVRQVAAFSLGLLGQKGPAVDALKVALGDASPLVQGRAAEALGAIGDTAAASAIAAMASKQGAAGNVTAIDAEDLRYPISPAAEAFRLGVYALARLKSFDALASVVLDPAGAPRTRWWPVAYALSRVDDTRAAPALRSLLSGPGSITRAFAAKGLQSVKDAQAAGALILRAQGWQEDPRAAVASIRALGALGASEAIPALRALLQVRTLDPGARLETVTALGALHDAGSLDRLIDLSGDPWPAMRVAVLGAIRAIDPDAFMLVLSGLDQDAHPSVRTAAARLLGTLEPRRAAPRLTAMLAERDGRVLPAVIEAVAALKAVELAPKLLTFLGHDDVLVRAAAAVAIGDLKLPGAEPALVAAFAAGERDGMYQARCGALTALTQYGAAVAMPVLRQALADKDWAVRVRAGALIHGLDPAADVAAAIRPAPGRPSESYAAPALVSPVVSPHVFLETDKGTVEIELAVLDAPQAAANFLALARSGYFSGVAIHRVVANFVVQDGDNRGDGEGSPGYTIRDEINERPYLRGTVGMALDWADTGGSQFFITHSPQPHLDGRYTVFGQVVAGMDVVDRLQQWDVIRKVRTWDGVELTVK